MEKIGIGIVGFGFIGRVHALAFSCIPYCYHDLPCLPEIRGIATSRPETAQKVKEETGVAFVTSSFSELINREDIDIVVVALPNVLHQEVVNKAACAKKAIYCDKPLSSNLKGALAMEEVVKEENVLLGVVFQNRFVPALWRTKELIQEGFLGEILRFRALYLHSGYLDVERPWSWRLDEELSGGGALLDLGSHLVDLLFYLTGEEANIKASWGKTFIPERNGRDVKVDDWSLVLFDLADGGEGSIESSRISTGSADELRLEIEGRKGAIRYNSMQPNYLEIYDLKDKASPLGGNRGFKALETISQFPPPFALPGKFPLGWINAHMACAHDFLLRFAGRDARGATLEDGIKVQKFIEDAYHSMSGG